MMKALFTAACLALAGSAFAQGAAVEEAARTALARGDYAKVVDTYRPLLEGGESLGDTAHYRLAIAHNRLSQAAPAWKHLTAALQVNPQGTFASTPARLNELRSAIQALCGGDCNPVDPAALAAPTASAASPLEQASADVNKPATGPQEAESPTAAAALAPAVPTTEPMATSTAPAAGAPTAPATTGQVQTSSASSMAVVGLQLLTILAVGWLVLREMQRTRRQRRGIKGIEALRDNVASLLESLNRTQGGRESYLALHLDELLPVLEREAGRAKSLQPTNLRAVARAEADAAQLALSLTPTAPDALTASASEIEGLFRRPAY